ncbi:probable G-protein coupled receptor Mth-like 10 isoform X1 [Euwallacea fornicatus]|uniref:probable G-protein coupled receptor Mth-like 10 isoform X1 n=1 Tax=Euwallacea fornicatus TaxID=995702 RepID=UPI00338EF5BA
MADKSLIAWTLMEIFFVKAWALHECCPNENLLDANEDGRCASSNSSKIDLQCDKHIMMIFDDMRETGFTLLNDGTLIDEYTGKFTNYCQFNTQNESKYIVCVDTHSVNTYHQPFVIQTVLMSISAVFALLTMAVYFSVPSLLDLQGICKMHMLAGLASSYAALLILQLTQLEWGQCRAMACIMYFAFFYMFFWLAILSFDIWRTSVRPNLRSTLNWPIIYHVTGIGGPLLALAILLTADYSTWEFWDDIRPGFGENNCWFKCKKVNWIYFYVPLLVLLGFNFLFYLWTIISLWKQVHTSKSKILKYRLKLCTKLCVIMGITWILEVITFSMAAAEQTITGKVLIFVLDLSNMIQGILIFLVLVVYRKRVRRALATKNYCNIHFPSSWKYLEDEEMESAEAKTNARIIKYNVKNRQAEDEVCLDG